MTYFPRIGWYKLDDVIAQDVGKETGLDPRRNIHGWGVRWLGYEVIFSVKETEWDAEHAGDIRTAQAFWEAVAEAHRPKPEPEVEAKKPTRKRKTKSGGSRSAG